MEKWKIISDTTKFQFGMNCLPQVGGSILYSTDDWFAVAENMLKVHVFKIHRKKILCINGTYMYMFWYSCIWLYMYTNWTYHSILHWLILQFSPLVSPVVYLKTLFFKFWYLHIYTPYSHVYFICRKQMKCQLHCLKLLVNAHF